MKTHPQKKLLKNKKASSMGIIMLVLVLTTMVGGYFFYNRVSTSIEYMTTKFNTEMTSILLKSLSINASCITSYIANTGIWAIKIVNAYVNQHIGTLKQLVEIPKNAVEQVYILGQFVKGITYTVELVNNFGNSISFEVTYN
ncbi:MAG: hypothetical protein CW691_09125 [Candidatus Bathyarchaeum sp.]|nr:MAG: hypothetical protein CW691_09125 [Candidatus Bathyarchaeum sp.]